MPKNNRLYLLSIPLLTAVILLGYFMFNKKEKAGENVPATIQPELAKYVSPISINYLRSLEIDSEPPVIEEELVDGSNYKRYLASYQSEGNKIYGLLMVPQTSPPDGGFPAIIFCHGYIPPNQYRTTEGYVTYVDYLARNGFIVFKIDYRGNGNSEGDPSGSYFSSAYTIDAISALKSIQKYNPINPNRIGIWGHSMAGNLVLRAMLVSGEIKAGVIWAGAVYSYKDFASYGINDSSYVHRPFETKEGEAQKDRETSPEMQKIRSDPDSINFDDSFWQSISLTANLNYLTKPLQIHHAVNDPTVNIAYSRDLVEVLKANSKEYEFFEYPNGGHNLTSPAFETAMRRTTDFFKAKLSE